MRVFDFHYEVTIGPLPDDGGEVHLFVPLPVSDERQRVLETEIDSTLEGEAAVESVYGNRYWHGKLAKADGKTHRFQARYRVERRALAGELPGGIRPEDRKRYLAPNELVVVEHPILDPILAEIRAEVGTDATPARTSRAIYDWVVDNVEYKKVGTGWGNGDTFWACSERYGNCTDFHALFLSLARTEKIPARFEMGFPVPESAPSAEIGGYHCWVTMYLDDVGWLGIDASEAAKNPAERERFYGGQPADRIHFSTGRDLRLGPDHKGPTLNYFVYPHLEVGGEPLPDAVNRTFRYVVVEPEPSGDGLPIGGGR
ncbi:MAG: transglutaminase domain-containing protein [Myxococcota bacterium]|nr:transglutaminase domain-containing protein [Myxococcota bacterium]